MRNSSRFLTLAAVFALVLAIVFGALIAPAVPASAVPAAAPTAVSVDRSIQQPLVTTLWDGESITADTRAGCIDTRLYNKLDVFYSVDITTVNTTTITLQHTNTDPNAAGTEFADGADIASGIVTDTVAMQQAETFGAWTCIYADVATTDTVSISINAMVK